MPNSKKSDLFKTLHNSAKNACNQPKCISNVNKISVGAGVKVGVNAAVSAFISSNATFNLLGTVFAGYPTIAPEVLKESARFQIPVVAFLVASIRILNYINDTRIQPSKDVITKFIQTSNRLAISLTGAVGMTSFFVPLTMELITRIIQLIEQEPRSSSVYISNGAAAVIIGGCMLTGLLQGMQTYFLEIKKANPSNQPLGCLSQTITHRGLRVTLGGIDTASAAHGLIMAVEKIAGINTETDTAYYTRSGFTLIMGVIGAIVHGFDKDSTDKEGCDKLSVPYLFMTVMKTMQFISLLLACYGTFIKSPAAESVFGEGVIDEQLWLWLLEIVLPIAACGGFALLAKGLINTDNLEEQQYLINNSDESEINDDVESSFFSIPNDSDESEINDDEEYSSSSMSFV